MRLKRFHQSITYWISIVGKILQVFCIVYFRTRMHQVTLTKKRQVFKSITNGKQ